MSKYIIKNNEINELFSAYSPISVKRKCKSDYDFISLKSPSILSIKEEYGDKAARIIILPYIVELCQFMHADLSDDDMIVCCDQIIRSYGFLTITEFSMFCEHFKGGLLGDIYGKCTPLSILSKINTFIPKLNYIREKIEFRETINRIENERHGAVSYSEYRQDYKKR